MGKMTRSDLLKELVEDVEGYEERDERRANKKERRQKMLRESTNPSKSKDKNRRAWKLQRAIRRGEYDFGDATNKNENKHTHEEYEDD